MNSTTSFIVWSVVIAVAFAMAWRFGWLDRITKYIQETREELRKCTWPGKDELWGSTVLVMVSTTLLGIFTVVVDIVVAYVVSAIV
ncbi:MAG: preprotein translocase subunit SecE [Verrucomicrobiales bacterium]|nr:preprotein translocase subunit SecE [Verrucomicrobiales bacterium]